MTVHLSAELRNQIYKDFLPGRYMRGLVVCPDRAHAVMVSNELSDLFPDLRVGRTYYLDWAGRRFLHIGILRSYSRTFRYLSMNHIYTWKLTSEQHLEVERELLHLRSNTRGYAMRD